MTITKNSEMIDGLRKVIKQPHYKFGLLVNFTAIAPPRASWLQLVAMKQNLFPVVAEIAKPKGIGLNELDGTVEALGTGIADSVLTEVEQTGLVRLQS